MNKIVILGGTGQVGTLLARAFHARGREVVVVARRPAKSLWRCVPWDGKNLGAWASELEGAATVINLAGRSVNCRYTPENRRQIMASRVDSARVTAEALFYAAEPPPVWLQMSTATIYAHRFDAPNDEATGHPGGGEPGAPDTWRFSIDVATAWEQAAQERPLPRTRLVLLRSAMVMSPDRGGVFDMLSRLVRLGLGGRQGSGKQWMSWIHEADFIRAIDWLIARPELAGAVNLCSPHPLPNAEFMTALRQAWRMPVGLPSAEWMLEIGARILRTETELILKSRRVTPGRLLESGFVFEHPTWPEAVRDLVSVSPSLLK